MGRREEVVLRWCLWGHWTPNCSSYTPSVYERVNEGPHGFINAPLYHLSLRTAATVSPPVLFRIYGIRYDSSASSSFDWQHQRASHVRILDTVPPVQHHHCTCVPNKVVRECIFARCSAVQCNWKQPVLGEISITTTLLILGRAQYGDVSLLVSGMRVYYRSDISVLPLGYVCWVYFEHTWRKRSPLKTLSLSRLEQGMFKVNST